MCDLFNRHTSLEARAVSDQWSVPLFKRRMQKRRQKYDSSGFIKVHAIYEGQVLWKYLKQMQICAGIVTEDCSRDKRRKKNTHNLFERKRKKQKMINEHNNQPFCKSKQWADGSCGFVLTKPEPHVHWAANARGPFHSFSTFFHTQSFLLMSFNPFLIFLEAEIAWIMDWMNK